ncbi:DUF3139 domain-containing protein [Bacillus sp. FJAT-53711]|uniref:DUF3139 domain-containing protein n=1 Tax=Bacillus yunxiaonensis TaxID=3127665 RepID=A0ABU8G1B2_9BACI
MKIRNIAFIITIVIICFWSGTSFYKNHIAHKVEAYLFSQGDQKDDLKSLEVRYDFKFGYMVDVTYKDESHVIYTYRYQKIGDTERKGVLAYNETLLDSKVNPYTYSYKHKHFGEY